MSLVASYTRHLWLSVIPHPRNDHRPYTLRHGSLATMSALLITAKVLAVGIIALTPATADLSTITSARIVQLTNEERRKAGLHELKVSPQLTDSAQQKGNDMLKEDYFAHISPSGVTPWFWLKKVGYNYQVAGENLAVDFTEAEAVVAAWMASPSHRENMLLPEYTEIGIGVATGEFQGGTSTTVVQHFALPVGEVTPQTTGSTLAAKVNPKPLPTPVPAMPMSVPTVIPTPAPTPVPTPVPAPYQPAFYLLSPATDQAQAAWKLADGTFEAAPINLHSPLEPHFSTMTQQFDLQAPARFSQLTRRLAILIGSVITVLLALAIFIRIRVQHPILIAHTSFVLLLAAALLFL